MIFVARKVSTKKVRKRVDRQLRKAGFKFLLYQRFCVTPVELFIPCTPEQ